jgi:hypothetical protein
MIVLKVPFAEKDEAKSLGARWNAARKVWYVPDGQASAPFERWITSEVLDKLSPPSKAKPAQVDSYAGKPVVGAHYIALEHACNPFSVCAECQPALEKSGWNAAYLAASQMLDAIRAAR